MEWRLNLGLAFGRRPCFGGRALVATPHCSLLRQPTTLNSGRGFKPNDVFIFVLPS